MPSIKQIFKKTRLQLLKNRYKHNSYDKCLDWNWKETNFNRIALVNLLVSKFKDCAYLEIGCESNILFDSVPVLNKTGVDPLVGGNVRKTSDDFFQSNTSQYDVVFVDGLHTYDQVRRDIINSIAALKPGGWIAIHDMIPRNWLEQHVPKISNDVWSGDVWKVAFELSQTKGIDFKILKIDYGVGVLKLTEEKPNLIDLRNELMSKQFSFFYENISKLPILEWADAQDWLRNN